MKQTHQVKFSIRWARSAWVVLVLMMLVSLAAPQAVMAQDVVPTIASDKADYAPGELVTITGQNWQGDARVHIFVNDDGNDPWFLWTDAEVDPIVAADGSFTFAFNLPAWFIASYTVTAQGLTTGRIATTTFTDLSIGTYDQCSNDLGDGYATGDTGCRWINGNLNNNNSRYIEGDSTVQRLWLTDFAPGSTHTVTFIYGTTKGGKHAYDFLTTWNWSENWITVADRCQGITGCETSTETVRDIPPDPNVPLWIQPSAPGDRQFVMRGGSLTGVTTPVIVSGTYAGDSETSITVSFTVAPSGPMCTTKSGVTTCGVAIWFGAHVGMTAEWMLIDGRGGAGNISGSPYHVALSKVDGASVGERDNQMQAAAIVANGTIVIIKDAIPNSPQDFNFNLSGGSLPPVAFALDDDADPTLSNTWSTVLPPGTYTAAELLPLPADWSLTSIVCVDPSGAPVINLASGTAVINLASAETVTCTYTNTYTPPTGSLKITKVVTGNVPPGFSQTFNFTATCTNDTNSPYNLSINYPTATEVTRGNIPVGSVCTVVEGPRTNVTGYTWGSPIYTPANGQVTITAKGGVYTVAVENPITRDQGYLKISKAFDPLGSGFTGKFSIVYQCGSASAVTVELGAGESTTVGPFPTGTSCTVSEPALPTPPLGWTFGTPSIIGSPATIVKGDQAAAVAVSVTNSITRDQGYLKISKAFDPLGSGFTGKFSIVYQCGSASAVTVELGAGESTTVGPFPTGTSCTVSEPALPTPPPGWTFGTPSIIGSPATIVKGDQAAAVAVSVTNSITRDQGYLKISKAFDPLGSGFTGKFSIVYQCGSASAVTVELGAGESTTVGPFPTGTSCTVTEPVLPTPPPGWTFGTPQIVGSPATIVKGDQTAAVVVSVTNSITRDQGYLKISKIFDPLTSGYNGTFAIVYNCGAGEVTVNLLAGASTTVGPFATGTSCVVSEATPTNPPTGWTFGTPQIVGSPAVIVKGNEAAAVGVSVTNTITRDQGYLKISKIFDPLTSGYNGTFAIKYNCGAGEVTVNLLAGASTTVGPFATGTSCVVSEATPTNPPAGWTFGTPQIVGSPAVIVKGNEAAAVGVSVTNTITRDQGYLKISKIFDPLTSGYNGTFAIVYNCGAGDVTVNLLAGASTTVGPFATGTSCVVSEATPTNPPTGWTFGTPQIVGSPAVIVKGDQAAAVGVSVTNTITRDQGYLKISKIFDPLTSGYNGTFAIVYNCGAGEVTVNLLAGASTTVGPFATGTSCVVSEATPTNPPAGWTFGTPQIVGSPAVIVKGNEAAAVGVSVTNTITRDQGYLKISKIFDPLTSGYNGTFAIKYNCGAGDVTVNLLAGASTTVGPFATGTSCVVSEATPTNPPAGWTFGTPQIVGSPAVIVKGDQAAAVAVSVTNTISQQAKIIVKKVTQPAGSQVSFQFSASYNAGGFSLTDGQSNDSGWMNPGIYSVAETVPAGWTLTSAVCSDESPINAINLSAGEVVTCTFTNTQDAALEVTKIVDWDTVTPRPDMTFNICIKGPSYPLGTEAGACHVYGYLGGSYTWVNLKVGQYTVTESNPGGDWIVEYTNPTPTVVAGQTAHSVVKNINTESTAVKLLYFKSDWVKGREVKLAWETVVEFDNYGFEIYRATVNDFNSVQLVGNVPSQVGSGTNRKYGFIDSTAVKGGKYFYWLVDISNAGIQTVNYGVDKGLAVTLFDNMYFLPAIQNR